MTDTTALPLAGLRVLELATGVAGPYAGRLFAMLGADVEKVEPDGGDPARRTPVDDAPLTGLSPLFVHLNAGKRLRPAGTAPLAELLAGVEIVICDWLRDRLDGTGLLAEAARAGAVVVSVTPFGVDGGLDAAPQHEVLVQARSGLIGVQGDPDREALRLPGWPAQYQAGAVAAVGALAALRLGARHVEVSWLGSLLVAHELHLADGIVSGIRRRPVGPFPTTAFPGGALPCADGFVVPGSFREIDWEMQVALYGRPELAEDPRFATRAARAAHRHELWELIRDWYAERTMQEIFELALSTPWTVGKVLTASAALADPHLASRGFLGPVEVEGTAATAPLRPFLGPGLGLGPGPVPDPDARRRGPGRVTSVAERPPLAGMTLLEVTTAWAGPFAGKLLGSLGMEVVKVEGLPPIDGYRVMRLHPDSDPPGWRHFRNDHRWFESSAVHNAVNRDKRQVVINLASPEGRDAFMALATRADAVLCNFTASVLPQLGIGFEDLVAVNPRIVVVRMPAFGATGPYSHAAGYGTVVEGMGGLGARFGYPEEGARISDLYWPDPVAGIHAALAILTGIERRDRTGLGGEFDVSHMEAMWCAFGEGIVAAALRGRDLTRMGNAEPGTPGGIVRAGDGRSVAYVVPAEHGDPAALERLTATFTEVDADELVAALRRAGARAEVVLEVPDVLADPRCADRFELVDHPVTGPVRQVRAPFVLDGRPATTRRAAPLFDQDTDAVLAAAGIGPEDLARLRSARVIGGTLPAPAALGL